jgi:hypothetical protein
MRGRSRTVACSWRFCAASAACLAGVYLGCGSSSDAGLHRTGDSGEAGVSGKGAGATPSSGGALGQGGFGTGGSPGTGGGFGGTGATGFGGTGATGFGGVGGGFGGVGGGFGGAGGALGFGGAGGAQPLSCNGVPCVGGFLQTPCCTPTGACGVVNFFACVEQNQPGVLDPNCPSTSFMGFPAAGCCRPDGTCGHLDVTYGFGCINPLDFALPAGPTCSPPDGGTDATPDGEPPDAGDAGPEDVSTDAADPGDASSDAGDDAG